MNAKEQEKFLPSRRDGWIEQTPVSRDSQRRRKLWGDGRYKVEQQNHPAFSQPRPTQYLTLGEHKLLFREKRTEIVASTIQGEGRYNRFLKARQTHAASRRFCKNPFYTVFFFPRKIVFSVLHGSTVQFLSSFNSGKDTLWHCFCSTDGHDFCPKPPP